MKNSNLERELRSRIDAFVADITGLICESTLNAVQNAFGAAPMTRAAAPAVAKPSAAPAVKAARKSKGGKRTSESVLEMASTLLEYIRTHEGERLDQIAKGLGISTKELKLPVQKLFAQKAIKTTGVKRGTTYFAK